jgi:hypothetical protein
MSPDSPVSPVGPVTPGGPLDPVAPAGPDRPCNPVAPVAPLSPVSPISPADPGAPSLPVNPLDPAIPVAPSRPVSPIAPAGPAAPGAPLIPVAPVAPEGPVAPGAPLVPVGPAAPVGPGSPSNPVAPVAPMSPVSPPAPAAPASPVCPATPALPAAPVVPVTPRGPRWPARPGQIGGWWTHREAWAPTLPVNATRLQGGRGREGQAAAANPADPRVASEAIAMTSSVRNRGANILGHAFPTPAPGLPVVESHSTTEGGGQVVAGSAGRLRSKDKRPSHAASASRVDRNPVVTHIPTRGKYPSRAGYSHSNYCARSTTAAPLLLSIDNERADRRRSSSCSGRIGHIAWGPLRATVFA